MFTIKHVHPDGQEFIHRGELPRYVPVEAKKSAQVQLPGEATHSHVAFDVPGWPCQILYSGTVYVMNENGKTVARYDLGLSAPVMGGEATVQPRMQTQN